MSLIGQVMSLIGEAALSSFFQSLFEKIECPEILKFAREDQVLADIRKLEEMLMGIQSVLEDAEEKQLSNPLVKMWLDELKDLAYDVEDILDEYQTESLQRQLKGETEAGSSKFRKLMLNPTKVSKMKEITTRFQRIVDQQKDIKLIKRNVGRTSSSKVCVRPPSTCLAHEPEVYGRDEDKRKILHLISSNDASDKNVIVIPIVGMGGSILESITKKLCDLNEPNQVQLQLREQLAGKKFLIVLDDVLNKNYDDWNTLRSPLMYGAPGRRVIVTTRDEDIARMMKIIQYHTLNCISDEDCWKLFLDHAFDCGSVADPKVEVIREKVINKCGYTSNMYHVSFTQWAHHHGCTIYCFKLIM
ncbi:hypothetical protein GH714_017800 [Hevea brasiliensis]|uniref:Rx N-terminal domain-containing protein n=1 Tax=Hevea brasiliensis TaxID=3981 RepID=A0A6A6N0L8_HEVBR|nr:hypothetical protein GH714_017800 [Hevea brasiliensis]